MPQTQRRIVRPTEADRICGLSKSTRYRLEAAGLFPKRVLLSERSSGYFSDEIEAWLASRPRGNSRAA
jgi:prophage regulatory protein